MLRLGAIIVVETKTTPFFLNDLIQYMSDGHFRVSTRDREWPESIYSLRC
jgi:regulator of sigma D